MKTCIHPTAVLGSGTQVAYYTVIQENVRIGVNCQIGHHVVIHSGTIVGNNVRIDDHATLGKHPMKAANSALTQDVELDPTRIGSNCLIGTSAILYRGCEVEDYVLIADQASLREQSFVGSRTIIGRGTAIENRVWVGRQCKIQAGVYIAGPSRIGNGCFIAPEVTVANDNFMGRTEERKQYFGGITIQDGGRIGANATILPGCTVEREGVAAAGAVVTGDIPAYKIVAGVPARFFRDVPANQLLENQSVRPTQCHSSTTSRDTSSHSDKLVMPQKPVTVHEGSKFLDQGA